jgi:hypothetical protein
MKQQRPFRARHKKEPVGSKSVIAASPSSDFPDAKWLSLVHVNCVAGVVALTLLMLSHAVVDQDLWHEVALAREYFNTGNFPVHDVFAYTPNVDFIHHEWGAGIIAYLFLELMGDQGIVLLKYVLCGLLTVFVVLRLRVDAAPLAAVAPVVLLATNMLQPGFGTVRAQIYSLVAVAALQWFLALDLRGNRIWVWAWLAIFVLWLNVHGGFVLAFGMLGAEWLERRVKQTPDWRRADWHLVLLGVAMLAVVAINPYGVRYYGYISEALAISRPDIAEWQPIWAVASRFPVSVGAFVASLPVLAYAVYKRGWRRCQGLSILLLFLVLSIRTNRVTMFFGLAFLCLVPGYLKDTPAALWLDRVLRRWTSVAVPATAIVAVFLLGIAWIRKPFAVVVPGVPTPAYGPHVVYPVGAIDYLKRHGFRGNLMVSFAVGAYVSWKLYPEVKVSMDSRYEVAYPPALAEKFIRAYISGEHSVDLLRSFAHDAVLVTARTPMRRTVEADRNWHRVYDDGIYALYARNNSTLPLELDASPIARGTIVGSLQASAKSTKFRQ